jgi:hypothetical protein
LVTAYRRKSQTVGVRNGSLAAPGEHHLSGSFSRKPTLKTKRSEATYGHFQTLNNETMICYRVNYLTIHLLDA